MRRLLTAQRAIAPDGQPRGEHERIGGEPDQRPGRVQAHQRDERDEHGRCARQQWPDILNERDSRDERIADVMQPSSVAGVVRE